MVQTVKFSQFNGPDPIQVGDIVVGLRNGDNHQFTGVGSGGGGSGAGVILVINQNDHGLQPGNWIRMNSVGNYVPALADDPQDAEIAGCVLSVENANQFTIQVIGFVDTGVFSGLVTGSVYFLSDISPGLMTLNEPVINGEVSLPVFIATSSTQGWIRQWRGFVIGGQPNSDSGGGRGPGSNPNIIVITQDNHNLTLGQVVRLNGSIDYVPAQANNLANSQAVGVVIQVIDSNTFVLQTEGYSINSITVDSSSVALVPGDIYYLSPTDAGAVTLVNPVTVGLISKPMFICEQQIATSPTGITAGYILPQRPIQITTPPVNPNLVNIVQHGSAFSAGNWLYISGYDATNLNPIYSLAIATSLATSQVVGVVISAVGDAFTLQTEGYNEGAITQDAATNPVTNTTVYYLSATDAGAITSIEPASAGLFTKPVYICEQAAANNGIFAGYIVPQRPLPYNSSTNPSIVTVNQAGHGLVLGAVIKINGAGNYVFADADNLADAQAVGMVIDVIDANNFVLQTEGYVSFTDITDDGGLQLVPGTPYYLSATVQGAVTSVPPSVIGQATKPMFICQSSSGVGPSATGYILPQRPLTNTSANTDPNLVTVTQVGNAFMVGDWVYISGYDSVNGNPIYALGVATSLATSQVVGVVVDIVSASKFTLQTNGYNIGAVTVDNLGNPIVQSQVYYLATNGARLGQVTNIPPTGANQFTKPLYASEQTAADGGQYAGYVLEQRPLPSDDTNNPNIVLITQAGHGLNLGDVVRLNGSINYVQALADNLADSQAVGVVIDVIDANHFLLQTEGYSSGAILTDQNGAALVPAVVYYLTANPAFPGRLTAIAPSAVGQATKPMFICEQAGASPAGYILPQRPLPITSANANPNIVVVTQPGHTFGVGNWLYVSGFLGANPVYSLGIATSLAQSQVVGVVIAITINTFTLQTEGYNTGAVTQNDTLGAIVQSNTYYLSTTRAGYITSTAPSGAGQFTKPLYISEQTTASTGMNAGYILPQRPLSATGGGGGGGGYQLISSTNITNQSTVPLLGQFGGYKNIKIIGDSIVFMNVSTGELAAYLFRMQYEVNGVIRTDSNSYLQSQAQNIIAGTNGNGLFMGSFIPASGVNSIMATPAPNSCSFEVDIYGVNSTTVTKNSDISCIFYRVNASTPVQGYQPFRFANYGSFVLSTLNVTGAVFNFYNPGLYIIQSGNISVYGIPI